MFDRTAAHHMHQVVGVSNAGHCSLLTEAAAGFGAHDLCVAATADRCAAGSAG
jgi:hypothetical protein